MTIKRYAAAAAAIALGAIGLATMPARVDAADGFDTTSCAYPAGTPMPGSGAVRNVPADYPTIQAAVDAANEGDTILLAAGTYHESTYVTKPGLRIRGVDRNAVIVDGQTTREIGFEVTADRVAVENMTVHSFREHGVRWINQHGYWGRYLTAYNNGLYGVFAFGSRCGQMDHSYTSGNADSGFYIGQCYPCDAVIHDVVAEGNAIGYSGTNAGGNLLVRDSVWRDNALGIVPNSLDGEARPPQRGAEFKNNLVADNNRIDAPGVGIAGTFYGVGFALAGATNNGVIGNTVTDHKYAGIAVTPLPDRNVWVPTGNVVWGNTVTHDATRFPDAWDLAQGGASGMNNCWADNTFAVSAPPSIQDIYSCALPTTAPGGDPRVEALLGQALAGLGGRAPADWRTWPAPGPQPTQTVDLDGALDGWLPALGL